MQNIPVVLTAAKQATTIQAAGVGFWYESATGVTGDATLVVRSARGDQVELGPGQSVRITEEVNSWNVSMLVPGSAVTANIIIGNGNFNDNNTTVATGIMAVSNFPATQAVNVTNEVEVKNSTGSPLAVSVSGTAAVSGEVSISGTPSVLVSGGELEVKNDSGNPLTVQENLIAITHAYASDSPLSYSAPAQILAPAANVNGAILQSAIVTGDMNVSVAIVAKASPPTSITDGTVLMFATGAGVEKELQNKLRVAAGLGIYFVTSSTTTRLRVANVSAL